MQAPTHTHTQTHTHTHTHRSVRASLFYTPKCKLLFGRHCRRLRDRQTDRHAEWSTAQSAQAPVSALNRDVQRVVDYTELLKLHESGLLNNSMMIFFRTKIGEIK